MQERALANPQDPLHLEQRGGRGAGRRASSKVRGVKLRNLVTGDVTEHAVDGVFVAIGHQPNTAFLKGQLPMDAQGLPAGRAGHAAHLDSGRVRGRRRRGRGLPPGGDRGRHRLHGRDRRRALARGRGAHAHGRHPRGRRAARLTLGRPAAARVRTGDEAAMEREVLEFDVQFIGAGPAGLAGAIHLADLIERTTQRSRRACRATALGEITIAVLEKSADGRRARHLGRGDGPARDPRADARLPRAGLPDRERRHARRRVRS